MKPFNQLTDEQKRALLNDIGNGMAMEQSLDGQHWSRCNFGDDITIVGHLYYRAEKPLVNGHYYAVNVSGRDAVLCWAGKWYASTGEVVGDHAIEQVIKDLGNHFVEVEQ